MMTTTEFPQHAVGPRSPIVSRPIGFDAVVEPAVPRPAVPRMLSFGIVLTVVALVVTAFVVGQMKGHEPVAAHRRELAAAQHRSADCQAAVRAADRALRTGARADVETFRAVERECTAA